MDEEEELEFDTSNKGFLRKLFIIDVFKKYGIVYGIIALVVLLCNIVLLIPGALMIGFKIVDKVINLLSGGNQVVAECYWAYLGISLIGIFAIWLTIKICDRVFATNTKKARTI